MTLIGSRPRRPTIFSKSGGTVAADNPEAADRVENAIYDDCTLIEQSPLAGQVRNDLTSLPLRFWTLRRWMPEIQAGRDLR